MCGCKTVPLIHKADGRLDTDAAIGLGPSRPANRDQHAEVCRRATAPLGALVLVMMCDASPDMQFDKDCANKDSRPLFCILIFSSP